MDQDRLPGGEAPALEHIRPDGEECLGQRRRIDQVEPARDRQSLRRGDICIFGIAATGDQCTQPVTDPPLPDAGATDDDRAGDFETGNIWRPGRRRIVPLALQHVRAD